MAVARFLGQRGAGSGTQTDPAQPAHLPAAHSASVVLNHPLLGLFSEWRRGEQPETWTRRRRRGEVIKGAVRGETSLLLDLHLSRKAGKENRKDEGEHPAVGQLL